MINFSAWAYADRRQQVCEEHIRAWTSAGLGSRAKHSATRHAGNYFLHAASDQPVGERVHWGEQVSLICDCDLLPTYGEDGVSEAKAVSPADRLAALYERYGEDFVHRLRGTFAIVVYDHLQGVLKAWTDHFGVRRIVYRITGDGLGVANDLRLVLSFTERDPELDPVAVVEYLQYSCIPAPRTIYKGFKRLEPGHQLSGGMNPTSRAYWDVIFDEGA